MVIGGQATLVRGGKVVVEVALGGRRAGGEAWQRHHGWHDTGGQEG